MRPKKEHIIRLQVSIQSSQIDAGPPPSQGDVEPQQRTSIDLTFSSTPDDTVEYTPLMTELLVDVNANPINRRSFLRLFNITSLPCSMTSDEGGATGSRRSWSQAFEDESNDMIVMKRCAREIVLFSCLFFLLHRRENTGGRKKKRDSGDSVVNGRVTPVPSNPVIVEQSLSLESAMVAEEAQEEMTSAASTLLLLVGNAPLIVWINVSHHFLGLVVPLSYCCVLCPRPSLQSDVGMQRNVLPDTLLAQLATEGDDGRPCDLSCIFMGWKSREFFRWFDRIEVSRFASVHVQCVNVQAIGFQSARPLHVSGCVLERGRSS